MLIAESSQVLDKQDGILQARRQLKMRKTPKQQDRVTLMAKVTRSRIDQKRKRQKSSTTRSIERSLLKKTALFRTTTHQKRF